MLHRQERLGLEATKSRPRTNHHRYLNILQLQSCDPCTRAHKARAPVRSLAIKAHDGSWKAWVQGTGEILPMETATWSPDTSLYPLAPSRLSSDGQKLAKEKVESIVACNPSVWLRETNAAPTSGLLRLTSRARLLSVVRG
jgi:hypothetical protein